MGIAPHSLSMDNRNWKFVAPRADLRPRARLDRRTHPGKSCLRADATGDPMIFGWWSRRVPLRPGKWYRARILFRHSPEVDPSIAVLINLFWGVYPAVHVREEFFNHIRARNDGWLVAEHQFQMPDGQNEVDWQLHFHSATAGSVWFAEPEIKPAAAPKPRPVTLATTWFDIAAPSTRERNLELVERRIGEVGKAHADIVLVPEEVTGLRVPARDYRQAIASDAEPVGGAFSAMYKRLASKYKMWVLGWIHEKDRGRIFNTVLIYDRKGKLVGRYRKNHLHWPELWAGISPGDEFPVFETDFGVIGINTCYEGWFPQVSMNLAMKGAEILFFPCAGYWLDVFRARCMDTTCYGVSACINNPSAIVGTDGEVLARVQSDGFVTAKVDLSRRPTHPTAYRHPNLTYGLPGADRLLYHSLNRRVIDEIYAMTHAPFGNSKLRGWSREA